MKVAVTGGTGFVGRFLVRGLVEGGHEVILLSRRPPRSGGPRGVAGYLPFTLGGVEGLPPGVADALVHAALEHLPGRYRGGEGTDAAGFLSRNLGGTIQLFEAARHAGVERIVFLSSRAAYGGYPPGTELTEEMEPRPDTLYGHVKREAEAALSRLLEDGIHGVSLRVTGVYGPAGPGRSHKWSDLFERFARGEAVEPRVSTEVHGDDMARAVRLFLEGSPRTGVWNVSDIVLDRADLLTEYGRIAKLKGPIPPHADAAAVNVMNTERLRSLGWMPRGRAGLAEALRRMWQEA
jgi:UDP-glucose 4-epimerase